MITIDGLQGEGGGQILRSSLALSMATGQPFHLFNIRAGRAKPGLMRQHLTCVQAAGAISSAQITGASVGSMEITFSPGVVRGGSYHFAIGTAGGATLVLQAVLPALLRANVSSSISVEGGTHNSSAPPFEFFERALVPLLNQAGAHIRTRIERHGFYPAGGGRIVVDIEPATEPRRLELMQRGERLSVRAVAIVSRLPRLIAMRELAVLSEYLDLNECELEVVDVPNPIGPGNAALVEIRYANLTEVFSAVGEIRKSAEQVARELAAQVREYFASQRPVGAYLADQLMVPIALLAGGRFATGPLSMHARTNVSIASTFGVVITVDPDGIVNIDGRAH